MINQTKQQEFKYVEEVVKKVLNAKVALNKNLEGIGVDNLGRLKELRESGESEMDLYLFIEQLHDKNEALNVKDKYKRLEELDYLSVEPYFARIDLLNTKTKETNVVYIGKFGYSEGVPVVTDWRTKVASVFYRYRYPQKNVAYNAPEGSKTRDLSLKRTYEIDKGKLRKFYNNDIQFDENSIIIEKIESRTGGVLEDIVETIQTSQLDIIEADPRQICVVQGCVGSGKSTVAIHKLAHIFFNHPKLIHANKSILVAKNRILVSYLSTLFPKLGIFDISYKTLRELMVHLLFREGLHTNVDLDLETDTSKFKISSIKNLQKQISDIHTNVDNAIEKIFSNPEYESFASFKYDSSSTPLENLTEILRDLEEELTLQRYEVKENPKSIRAWLHKENIKTIRSIKNKINDVKNQLRKKTFNQLLIKQKIDLNEKLSYFQALVYLYIYSELMGISKFPKYEYCVIDEGQDFSVLEYAILSKIVLRGRFAIFGDLNQSLERDGIASWDDIKKVIKEAKTANTFELDTNYRSTKPIIELASSILKPYTRKYLPKSINRAGNDPSLKVFNDRETMFSIFEEDIKTDLNKINKSVGIICFEDEDLKTAEMILDRQNIPGNKLIKLEKTKDIHYIPAGVYLMDFEDCKGLEFAKVYVLNLNLSKLNDFEKARQAFVAITRAMNELSVYGVN